MPFLDVRPVFCDKTWRNVRRMLGTSVIKDTLINKETVKANQSLSFTKHTSIRAYGTVKS